MTNQDLAVRLDRAEKKWQLRIGKKLGGGFRSEVFACTTAEDNQVVLKLVPTREGAAIEAMALKSWTGVAVNLIDVDLDDAALLLERLYPGTPLSLTDEPGSVAVAADILKTLHAIPPHAKFPVLEGAYAHHEKRAQEDARYEQEHRGEPNRGKPALDRLSATRQLVQRLCRSASKTVLLHGDFLAKNILLKESRFVVIDPMPMMGDPCSDIGFFAAGSPGSANIFGRAEAIAKRNDENPLRAQQWAVIWVILQAAQSWRADQAELEQFVQSERVSQLLQI